MIDLQRVKAIIFDFGGVLINLKRERTVKKFTDLGIKDIDLLLNNYKQAGIFLDLEKGYLNASEFRNAFRSINNTNLSDDDIDSAFMLFLLDIPQYKLDMLLELKKQYRIIMLSNTNPIHFPYCIEEHFNKNGKTIDDYFDKCYLSYEMKMAKPDKEIFSQLLKEEQIQAENCLFIDDGEANIIQAQEIGFQTYLAKEHEDFRHLFKGRL